MNTPFAASRSEGVAAVYVNQAAPYTTDPPPSNTQTKTFPPGADPRQVRPAEAFPPERIEKPPQAPSRAGVALAPIR